MNFLYFIAVMAVVLLFWTVLAYFMYFCLLTGTRRRVNSPKMKDEKILREYKSLDTTAFLIFLLYGGPIGLLLAKKKFIPNLKSVMEEKMRERNISF